MTKNHTATAAATRTKMITTTIPAILEPVKTLDDFEEESGVLFDGETGFGCFGGGGGVYGGGGGAEVLS